MLNQSKFFTTGKNKNYTRQYSKYLKKLKKIYRRVSATSLPSKKGGRKHTKWTENMLIMVCKDCEPLSIIEREVFTAAMKYVVPNYKIPDGKRFSDH